MNVAAIVLAAGSSRRMGSSDKLAVSLAGQPVLGWSAAAVAGSEATPVFLVHRRAKKPDLAVDVTYVAALDAEKGQSHSLAAGIQAALHSITVGVLVCLGDMPLLTVADINLVIDAGHAQPNLIHRPVYTDDDGVRIPGHPVYWPRDIALEMVHLDGDDGAKSLLRQHKDRINLIPFDSDRVVFDVDTPDRLVEAEKRLTGS